jgi:hypothetical protein
MNCGSGGDDGCCWLNRRRHENWQPIQSCEMTKLVCELSDFWIDRLCVANPDCHARNHQRLRLLQASWSRFGDLTASPHDDIALGNAEQPTDTRPIPKMLHRAACPDVRKRAFEIVLSGKTSAFFSSSIQARGRLPDKRWSALSWLTGRLAQTLG